MNTPTCPQWEEQGATCRQPPDWADFSPVKWLPFGTNVRHRCPDKGHDHNRAVDILYVQVAYGTFRAIWDDNSFQLGYKQRCPMKTATAGKGKSRLFEADKRCFGLMCPGLFGRALRKARKDFERPEPMHRAGTNVYVELELSSLPNPFSSITEPWPRVPVPEGGTRAGLVFGTKKFSGRHTDV